MRHTRLSPHKKPEIKCSQKKLRPFFIDQHYRVEKIAPKSFTFRFHRWRKKASEIFAGNVFKGRSRK